MILNTEYKMVANQLLLHIRRWKLLRRLRHTYYMPRSYVNGRPCRICHTPFKRSFDIVFSLLALILGLPLFLLIIVAIKITSKGPAVFGHSRVGRGGSRFTCYKFRSMYDDADRRLNELLIQNPAAGAEWASTQKLKKDPRVTPLGRFLRQTSLDELPQFWNVLMGEMSVVGPRAVMKEEIDTHYRDKAPKVLSIRPGLTCLWQVGGRNNTTYAERVRLDELYVDTRTFALDLLLIIKTVPVMIFSKGAY